MIVGTPYDRSLFNCATAVCEYYREQGVGDIPNGDLAEYTHTGLLWIKNNFIKADNLTTHTLLVCRNPDNTLHVGVFDGTHVLHADSGSGQAIREPLWLFTLRNKRISLFKWRHL